MTEKSIEITENYTNHPNVICDYWLPILGGAEFQLLYYIVRKTIGWNKKGDQISLSQFTKGTGLDRRTIMRTIENLENLGLISRTKLKRSFGDNDATLYEINLEVLLEGGGKMPLPEGKKPLGGGKKPLGGGKSDKGGRGKMPPTKESAIQKKDIAIKKERISEERFSEQRALEKRSHSLNSPLLDKKSNFGEDSPEELKNTTSDNTCYLVELSRIIDHYSITISNKTLEIWLKKYGNDRVGGNLELLILQKAKVIHHERWMENALKKNYAQEKKNIKANREFIELFKKKNPWKELTILEKYCRDETTGNDYQFHLDPNLFSEMIERKYECQK